MNRPTIILGAGSAIEIDAPSTAKITEEIIKPNKYINYWGHSFSDKKTYFTPYPLILALQPPAQLAGELGEHTPCVRALHSVAIEVSDGTDCHGGIAVTYRYHD